METKNKTEKREGFKFSNRTISNIHALIEMKLARNKTEAIDIALEHIVTEERTKQSLMRELKARGMLGEVGNAPTGERTEMLSGCNNLAEIFGVHQ